MPFEYLRAEGRGNRIGARLMAIVAEGNRKRVYLPAAPDHESVAQQAMPNWEPDVGISHWPGRTNVVEYGLTTFADLFTPRQLVALTTFSDLVQEARERVQRDAAAGLADNDKPLQDGGDGPTAYAEAVGVYLAFAVDRVVDRHSSIATWDSSPSKLQLRNTYARQAIPMTWDFGEGNPFCMSSGTWLPSVNWVTKSILSLPVTLPGIANQTDASMQHLSRDRVVSTDPPYYDNIGYADLSDFFYVWLRRTLKLVFPGLFATLAVPKAEELVATPYRHGSKEAAETFFLEGMSRAMRRLAEQGHPRISRHDLLRLQASGAKREHRSIEHWLGDISGRRDSIRLRNHRHMADAHRTRQSDNRHGYQRARLQHRSRLSCPTGRRARRHAPRVSDRAPFGTAAGLTPPPNRQRRPCRPRPSRHRSRHGGIHPLRQGARRGWQTPVRTRCAGADQSDSRRGARRAGRRLRRRQPLGGRLVRAARLRRG